jgi:hypothetical protein
MLASRRDDTSQPLGGFGLRRAVVVTVVPGRCRRTTDALFARVL